MPGPPPKPTHLKVLAGNPGKRPLNRDEPRPKGDLFQPPADLPAGALPFWTQAIADAPAGLLKRLDARLLFVWSVAAYMHADAASKVARSALMVQSQRSGEVYQHPLLSVMNRQALIMLRAAAELGFTPSSRTRIKVDAGEASSEFDEFA